MASIVQLLRRINGAAGSPATAGRLEGELFTNFPGAPGSGTLPELWAYDGAQWRRVNPPGVPDPYATNAEVLAGTSLVTKVNPANLQSRTRSVSAGAADAGYLVRLNASGKVDSTMMSVSGGMRFIGATNLAVTYGLTPAGGLAGGDYVVHNGANQVAVHASYTGAAALIVDTGDMLLYDGAAWHVLQSVVDLSGYLLKAGGSMIAGAAVTFAVPAGAGLVVRLDGTTAAKSSINNFTLDGGVV